ncbi:M56 family metallopeptidase [Sphingomicrobium sp. XHP0235]|uniref:M56 family metallopeptidase n=1 Tax=Sphingomicrobium aquimarinum TaxID=3133971 RepID=UPI0031FEDEA6
MTGWLVETLLWTSVLMLLVLLVRGPVASHFGARVAYALWLIPAARFLTPTLTTVVQRAPSPALSEPTMLSPVGEVAAVSVADAAAPVANLGMGDAQLGLAADASSLGSVDWVLLFGLLWVTGAIVTFVYHHLRYLRDRRAILSSATELARIGGIRLVVSPDAPGPMALGILDRVIAFPERYRLQCSEAELDLAIEHELAHHRSGDLWARSAGLAMLSLHWFNPIAWKAYAAFHFDQEAACDARVLARHGGAARADYGRAIARAVAPARILTANARDTDLKRRLKMMKNVSHRPLGLLMIAALTAAIVPATASRAIEFAEQPVPPEPPSAPTPPEPPAPPSASEIPLPPEPPLPPVPPLPPEPPTVDRNGNLVKIGTTVERDGSRNYVRLDGERPYSQMSREERREYDEALVEMREALTELRQERVEARLEMREAMMEARREIAGSREERRRDLEEARRDIREAIAEVEANSAELRRDGKDPELIKASLRASMAALRDLQIEPVIEASLSSVDESVVDAAMEGAEQGLRAAIAAMEARRNR